MKFIAAFLGLVATTSAMELTAENWDEVTAGKTVFVTFGTPKCGHCASLKPAWDELMGIYADSASVFVASVDCVVEGRSLCEEVEVKGYPSLKYGDPSDLQDYEGGRDADSLKKFAEGLKPMCSHNNIDLCNDEKKAEITKYQTMPDADLAAAIETQEKKVAFAEEIYQEGVKGVQEKWEDRSEDRAELSKRYELLSKAKKDTLDEVWNSGLELMQAVKAAKDQAATTVDEL
jgi:thiol-disulfide isomerase/thioredoxin